MLGNLSQKIYLSIANGKIQRRDRDGNVTSYDMLEGVLTGIRKSSHEIAGKPTAVISFELNDGDDNYVVGVIADSGVARSLVKSIYGIKDFSGKRIRIVTRLRVVNDKEYTNAFVYVDGEQAKWAVEFPKAEQYTLANGESVTSTKDRDDMFWKCVDEIIGRLSDGTKAAPQQPADPQEDPSEPAVDFQDESFYRGGVNGMFGEDASY